MLKSLKRLKSWCGAMFHLSKEYVHLWRGVRYDFRRYRRHAVIGWNRRNDLVSSLEALIIKEYHAVEKGLAMPDFRPSFGRARVRRLMTMMSRFRAAGGAASNRHFGSALRCLAAYRERHGELGVDVDAIVPADYAEQVSASSAEVDGGTIGGVREVTPESLFADAEGGLAALAESRTSCRVFDPSRKVDPELLRRAVSIAVRAPSVCNRQAWRVHAYHEREVIDRLLGFQNGNAGFGDRIPCLLVVTADLACFEGAIERYQAWIDGGMFGMLLLLALHSVRLGAVPLNWDVPPANDLGLRAAAGIADSESVIMLIGTGHPAERFLVPVSQRREVEEILSEH